MFSRKNDSNEKKNFMHFIIYVTLHKYNFKKNEIMQ